MCGVCVFVMSVPSSAARSKSSSSMACMGGQKKDAYEMIATRSRKETEKILKHPPPPSKKTKKKTKKNENKAKQTSSDSPFEDGRSLCASSPHNAPGHSHLSVTLAWLSAPSSPCTHIDKRHTKINDAREGRREGEWKRRRGKVEGLYECVFGCVCL